jgi:hypothetical protein
LAEVWLDEYRFISITVKLTCVIEAFVMSLHERNSDKILAEKASNGPKWNIPTK